MYRIFESGVKRVKHLLNGAYLAFAGILLCSLCVVQLGRAQLISYFACTKSILDKSNMNSFHSQQHSVLR